MPYSKTTWKDRAVEHPRTYTIQDNGDGTITLVPAPGTVYEQGTPVNAANLNKIEQGIADATATAEAALPKRVITSGTFDFNALGGGSFIYEIKNNASITVLNGPTGRTSGVLLQTEDSHDKWCEQIFFAQGVPQRIYYRVSVDASGVKAWRPWVELITSEGGQTINSSLKISSSQSAIKLFDTDSNNSVWLLHDNNSFYLQLRDANGNWIRDIMRLTDDGLTRKLGNDDIWHTGMLRNNSGVLELNNGGVWTPVGGIKSVQRGSTTTYFYDSDPDPDYTNEVFVNQIDVPISAVNVNKAYVVVTSGYSNGNNYVNSPGTNYRAELLNATTVRVYAAAPNNNNLDGVTVHWQVVEFY